MVFRLTWQLRESVFDYLVVSTYDNKFRRNDLGPSETNFAFKFPFRVDARRRSTKRDEMNDASTFPYLRR